jgi:hypothetical protein
MPLLVFHRISQGNREYPIPSLTTVSGTIQIALHKNQLTKTTATPSSLPGSDATLEFPTEEATSYQVGSDPPNVAFRGPP